MGVYEIEIYRFFGAVNLEEVSLDGVWKIFGLAQGWTKSTPNDCPIKND